MKPEIHPTYYKNANVACACGAKYTFGSTKDEIKVEICSACHPFFTGKQKLVDTAGRVDKFRARMEASQKLQAERSLKEKKQPKVTSKESSQSETRDLSKKTKEIKEKK